MEALLLVVLPVFVVVGFGYIAVWSKIFPESGVDGLMVFTQKFAIPCLLFTAISKLDLGESFHLPLLASFYTGALTGFLLGLFGARYLFGRDWEDAVAVGFIGLFSNSLLLGVPITERAYGTEALSGNFAIIAIHSPLCYGIGITVMEIVRARGQAGGAMARAVLKAMFSNALIIGVSAGLIVNLTGLTLPAPLTEGLEMMSRAALPAALFGMGGVLYFYRPEGDLRLIFYIVVVSLVIHPLITFGLAESFDLSDAALRSAVMTAAMAPGVNTYVFANMYGRARRVAASAVLIGTGLTVITAWVWLSVLP